MSMEMDFSGLHLSGPEEAIKRVIPIAVLRAAEHVKSVAQSLTPVETGRLVGSAEARPSATDPNVAEVYFAGPYARYQHYGPHFNPEVLHHEHGQGLFLETPMVTEAETAMRIYVDTLKEAGVFE